MRRKRAHIVWQPITRKKRKLRTFAQTVNANIRPGEAYVRTEPSDPSRFSNIELAKPGSTLQDTEGQEISYAESQTHPIPYDEYLLEKARTQWQFGDWESLAKLDRDTLQHHPDRAKLALLAAAGRLQAGNDTEARQYIRLAKDWGVGKRLISQILISSVHNSLGRAAAIGNQPHRALEHFKHAIQIGTPGSDARLLIQARSGEQLDQLGLRTGSQGLFQRVNAVTELSKHALNNSPAPACRSAGGAHGFYLKLDDQCETLVPFLLLDSKSLPRSGLHYLKHTLAQIFGEHFSFCEWYQEPGCCKQMPCALTGVAKHAQEINTLRIRLIKSHDFELTDPTFEANRYLRRVILVRDPLYILTSWFSLDQLNAHKDILASHGISINKIWLAHEKEVLKPAYDLIDQNFRPPAVEQLTVWLKQKSKYIAGFTEKWVKPASAQSEPFTQIVRYEQINSFVQELINEYRSYLSEAAARAVEFGLEKSKARFSMRTDPFSVPSNSLSDYIERNKALFVKVASNLDG